MNRFIMANSQQCLGCHACEVACVMAHNDERHVLTSQRYQPRITVIKHQHQRSAVTCHHCEDAPCARSCPNGAIAHINNSVQVNAQKCIGCKSCVVACPFGTMQMVLTPVAPNQFKASAHKCDLCQGREQGPACVENCPAGRPSVKRPAASHAGNTVSANGPVLCITIFPSGSNW